MLKAQAAVASGEWRIIYGLQIVDGYEEHDHHIVLRGSRRLTVIESDEAKKAWAADDTRQRAEYERLKEIYEEEKP
jgi:hypothetical protein